MDRRSARPADGLLAVLRFAGTLLAPLVPVLLVGAISTLVSIGTIGGSDSCGGCDTQPTWAKVGLYVFEIGLIIWLIYAVVLVAGHLRVVHQKRARASGGPGR